MSDAGLVERFRTLWGRMAPAGGGLEVGGRVLAAYEEPHRHYHGVEHLRDCLSQLDAAPATRADRDLAETALWFHDAVYDPRASDNEARSAEWAERALSDAGAPEPRAREVGRLIRLTDHARPPGDPAGALVCDVDLSVLGRPTAEFDPDAASGAGAALWVGALQVAVREGRAAKPRTLPGEAAAGGQGGVTQITSGSPDRA